VYYGAILNIYFIADAYAVYITTYHSIKPYAAIITHYHITYNSGIGCYKTIFAHGGHYVFYRKDYCHNFYISYKDTKAQSRIDN
jgi:hypothetical protein